MKKTLRYTLFGLVGYAASSATACGGGGTTVSEEGAGEDLGKAICKWLFECDCMTTHADQEACEMAIAMLVETGQESAKEAELTFDGSCLGGVIDDVNSIGCDSPSYGSGDSECAAICKDYHGDKGDGEPCSSYSSSYVTADDCEQGLYCGDPDGTGSTVCHDPCDLIPEWLGEGADCEPTMPECDPFELMCDPTEMKCVALPSVGEACPAFQCQLGGYCDMATMECVAQKGDGEACMTPFECESLNCGADGMCAGGDPQVCGYA